MVRIPDAIQSFNFIICDMVDRASSSSLTQAIRSQQAQLKLFFPFFTQEPMFNFNYVPQRRHTGPGNLNVQAAAGR